MPVHPMKRKKISVLIPSYNEAEQLPTTISEIPKYIPDLYDYEVFFVDDGSTDRSWEILQRAAAEDPRLRALRFSRNFGKEKALMAGLLNADGDAVIIMDCDLQHPPKKIPEMLRLWEEGYLLVQGVKADRGKESAFSRLSANAFYHMFSRSSDIDLRDASDFQLLDRRVVECFRSFPEKEPFFRAISHWIGFPRTEFSFEVEERKHGRSRWSLEKLSLLSLNALAAYSKRPLLFLPISAVLAYFFSLGFLIGAIAAGKTLLWIHCSIFFCTGLLLTGASILSLYLAQVHTASLERPRYIVAESLGRPEMGAGAGERVEEAERSEESPSVERPF